MIIKGRHSSLKSKQAMTSITSQLHPDCRYQKPRLQDEVHSFAPRSRSARFVSLLYPLSLFSSKAFAAHSLWIRFRSHRSITSPYVMHSIPSRTRQAGPSRNAMPLIPSRIPQAGPLRNAMRSIPSRIRQAGPSRNAMHSIPSRILPRKVRR
jgi:hypothetical protein